MKYAAVLAISALLIAEVYGGENTDLNRDRFLKDYADALPRINEAYGSFEAEFTSEELGPNTRSVYSVTRRLQGTCAMTRVRRAIYKTGENTASKLAPEEIFSEDSRYYFHIVANGDAYKILKIEPKSVGDHTVLNAFALFYAVTEVGIPYREIGKAAGFEFEKYQEMVYEGRPARQLVLKQQISGPLFKRYTAIFLPEMAWACVSLSKWSSDAPDTTIEQSAAFEKGTDGIPAPVNFQLKAWINSVPRVLMNEKVVAFRRVPPLVESEFTLSHYGLPEPEWAVPKRSYLFLYLVAGALVTIVVSTLILRRIRRVESQK